MIFDLVKDFADVLDAIPEQHSRRRILNLLDEAIRRDVHFLERHPTSLFQCTWNTCWWYDRPEVSWDSIEPEERGQTSTSSDSSEKAMYALLEHWRGDYEQVGSMLLSLRPPHTPLRSGLLLVLTGYHAEVTHASFSADGRVLMSIGSGMICLWDVRTGKCTARRNLGTYPTGGVLLSGCNVALVSSAGSFSVWDVTSGEDGVILSDSPKVTATKVDLRRTRLVAGFSDGAIQTWNPATLQETGCIRLHDQPVCALGISADSEVLVAIYSDGDVRSYDFKRQMEVGSSRIPESYHRESAICSADGHRIAVNGLPGPVIDVFDLTSQSRVAQLPADIGFRTEFSPDGHYLCRSGFDGRIRVWDLNSPETKADMSADSILATAIAFSPDGELLAIGSSGGTLRIWHTESVFRERPSGEHKSVKSTAVSSDGQRVVASVGGQLKQWERFGDVKSTQLNDDRKEPTILSLSATGDLVAALWPKHLSVFRWRVESPLCEVELHSDAEDQDLLSGDSGILLVDENAAASEADAEFDCVCFDVHGSRILTGMSDGTVRVWDVETGAERNLFRGHSSWVKCLAVSSNGHLAASGGHDAEIHIWSLESSAEVTCLKDSGGRVLHLAFSPDGHQLLSGSMRDVGDWDIRVWDMHSQRPLATTRVKGDIRTLSYASSSEVVWLDAVGELEFRIVRLDLLSGAISVMPFPGAAEQASVSTDGQIWTVKTTREYLILRSVSDS
jgi:WD40 repeat protein